MATTVYVLCAITSIVCTWLLVRSWRESRVRLLLWTALCFAGLAVNNIVLFLDKVVAPDTDLSSVRLLTGLAGLVILLFGLIWESE